MFKILLAVLFSVNVYAAKEPKTKVAIIDTGFTPMMFSSAWEKICKTGHYDYSKDTPTVGMDVILHGSLVALIITDEAPDEDYCLQIYKVMGGKATYVDVARAINKAVDNGAKVINLSLTVNVYTAAMHKAVIRATRLGVKIFAAAGNAGQNLNEYCNVFPQCLKRINNNLILVGAANKHGELERYSNYGVKVAVYNWGDIGQARGTSFAAPRALAQYLTEAK